MVMRLIRQQDRERQGIGFDQIESPFFAEGMVKRAIQSYGDGIFGLRDFLLANGRTRGQISEPELRQMLATVENGDWLLVTDDPFSPMSEDRTGRYRCLSGWRMASLDYHPVAHGMLPFSKTEPGASLLPQDRSKMAQQFATRARVTHDEPAEPAALTTIRGNDRAATREAIIRLVRKNGYEFEERSSWGAHQAKGEMIDDWDYSMIALHHAGRSVGCGVGQGQMRAIQSAHQTKFDDIGYHYGIDCMGNVFEGRDIRFKGSSVHNYNTGVIGIVLLENLTTAGEGGDLVALARQALETMNGNMDQEIPAVQINALLNLVQALTSVFGVTVLGGHREFPMQAGEGKICPGNIGMRLVRDLRIKTNLQPPSL
ncbi:peptidoglycan recognition family protein [Pseudomonas putida]|uniref:peptidoglycan recognition protein family protein n=2 Tax=Pseudomonas TaxID=286 RepID=UPI00211659C0|nr:peptidoglycan recognition family protein [Pseudomonas putida]